MQADRDELLKQIIDISESYPDMRLGQLLCNLVSMSGKEDPGAIWDAEDGELIPAARQFARDMRDRVAASDEHVLAQSA